MSKKFKEKWVTGAFTHLHIQPRRFHSHSFQPL